MTDREALAALLRARSLRFGDFLLSSGQRSTYYIDARLTTLSAESAAAKVASLAAKPTASELTAFSAAKKPSAALTSLFLAAAVSTFVVISRALSLRSARERTKINR